MKVKHLLLLCLSALLPALAVAASDDPAGEARMDAATLGRLDAMLGLCAKAGTKNRAAYEKLRGEMIVFAEGTPYEMRAPGSDTPDYKKAHAETVDALGKSSAEELVEQCGRWIGVPAEVRK